MLLETLTRFIAQNRLRVAEEIRAAFPTGQRMIQNLPIRTPKKAAYDTPLVTAIVGIDSTRTSTVASSVRTAVGE